MRAAIKEQLLMLPFLAPAFLGVIGGTISDESFNEHVSSVHSEPRTPLRSADVVRSNRRLTGRL